MHISALAHFKNEVVVMKTSDFASIVSQSDLGKVGLDTFSCSVSQHKIFTQHAKEVKPLDGPKFPVTQLKIIKN